MTIQKRQFFGNWGVNSVGCGVCLIFTIGVYVVLIHPFWQHNSVHAQQKQQLSSYSVKLRERTNHLGHLQHRLDGVRRHLKAGALQLKPASVINQHLAALTDLANEYHLNVGTIQPESAIHNQQYAAVRIRLTASGDFPNCTRFLHALHIQFPDTSVSSFDLAGEPQAPGTPVRFEIDLEWYTTPTASTQ